jgi:hypothetical protein
MFFEKEINRLISLNCLIKLASIARLIIYVSTTMCFEKTIAGLISYIARLISRGNQIISYQQ